MSDDDRFSVLFLCTHNSARSQLAEAILRKHGGLGFRVASAGSEPSGRVHPVALDLIREIGGDPGEHTSKGMDQLLGQRWDLVVTVCDQAQEACPVLSAQTTTAHWSIPDPTIAEGTEAERRAAFRAACDELAGRIDLLLALDPRDVDRRSLRERLESISGQAGRPSD